MHGIKQSYVSVVYFSSAERYDVEKSYERALLVSVEGKTRHHQSAVRALCVSASRFTIPTRETPPRNHATRFSLAHYVPRDLHWTWRGLYMETPRDRMDSKADCRWLGSHLAAHRGAFARSTLYRYLAEHRRGCETTFPIQQHTY